MSWISSWRCLYLSSYSTTQGDWLIRKKLTHPDSHICWDKYHTLLGSTMLFYAFLHILSYTSFPLHPFLWWKTTIFKRIISCVLKEINFSKGISRSLKNVKDTERWGKGRQELVLYVLLQFGEAKFDHSNRMVSVN